MRLRRFCFTLNNYNVDDVGSIIQSFDYQYIIVGREVSPKSGTPHLQGYVELGSSPLYFEQIKEKMPRAHIEPCRGSQVQNIDYCRKGGNYQEFGIPKVQGRRTDLAQLSELCRHTNSIRDLLAEHDLSLPALKAALELMPILGKTRAWPTKVFWYYGPTGTGKTRSAMAMFADNPDDLYFKSVGTKHWWQGYDGQRNVILDDIRPDDFTFSYLLGLFDRYAFTVETKGGSRQFLAENIVVTCPWCPKQFLSKMDSAYGERHDQLIRRIFTIQEFK